jgi:drug/metabolite transporter (DMT)-like permease
MKPHPLRPNDSAGISDWPQNDALRGIAWMVLAQVLFSIMNVCIRLGAQHVPWPETALARFAVGTIVAYAMAKAKGVSLRIVDKKTAWTRSICGTLSALAIFYTLSSPAIPVGDAVTLNSLGPIFVVLLSWPMLGERTGKVVLSAVPIAFVGILLVVKPSFHVAMSLAAVALCGAFFYAVAMISLRKIGPNETGEAVVLHFSLLGMAVMLCCSIPIWRTPDLLTMLNLILIGVCGGLAQLAMTKAFSLERASRISPLNYLGIIFTNLFAVPVFGDRPGSWQVMGAFLVILSGLVIGVGAHREKSAG